MGPGPGVMMQHMSMPHMGPVPPHMGQGGPVGPQGQGPPGQGQMGPPMSSAMPQHPTYAPQQQQPR